MNDLSKDTSRSTPPGGSACARLLGHTLLAGAALVAMGLAGCGSIDPWDWWQSGGGGSAGAGGGPAVACEVDGVTFPAGSSFPSPDGCNECFCDENGSVACTERACFEPCGGLLGLQCGEDKFCRFELGDFCGAADQTGICTSPPDACTEQFDPVCGCDGQTYPNECFAHAAGVSAAASGECEASPPGCEVDLDCQTAEVCQEGRCVAEEPSIACGGIAGLPCPDDQFCAYSPEASCGAADRLGTCASRPEICTQQYDPVCGCDGVTYGNACNAASAGVSVAAAGECETETLAEGDFCGGFRPPGSPECGDGLFCQYQPGALCGAADAPGVCVSIPSACTRQYDPVCGCDGVTYGNACTAAAAQAGILESGECGQEQGQCSADSDCPPPPCPCFDPNGDGACENVCPVPACEAGACVLRDPTVLAEGDSCGGFVPFPAPQCGPGLFCQHQPGALCGAADAPGVCVSIPERCGYEREPVCGCDGNGYLNACWAAEAEVGIFETGKCK